MHILIVEDREHDYQIAKRALANSGLACETTWVSRGEEALERLQTDSFDIVLIDFELLGISAAFFVPDAGVPQRPLWTAARVVF